MKNQRGITLIALVITIIVLLILAGVSIAMLTGKNGILTRSNQAAFETAFATARENIANAMNEVMTDYYGNVYVDGGTADMSDDISAALVKLASKKDSGGATIEYTAAAKTISIKYDGYTQTGNLTTDDEDNLIGGVTWPADPAKDGE